MTGDLRPGTGTADGEDGSLPRAGDRPLTRSGNGSFERPEDGPFDRAFGALIARMQRAGGGEAAAQAEELALWARRASRAVSSGHACLDLAGAAGSEEAHARATSLLRASPLVGLDRPGRPLVLSAQGRLYLERYWRYETELAAALRARAGSLPAVDLGRAAAVMRQHCGPQSGLNEEQRRAAALVLVRRLAVVSGGPGTGKTTTIARALSALRDLHGPGFVIRLAAPTGKAAARLTEAVGGGLEGVTLHRLLGLGRSRRSTGQDGQLALDCLVIDEASMLDLSLAATVARALPESARLVLLGDHDQLASVEAGGVMASLCARRSGYSESTALCLERLTGGERPPINPHASALEDCVVLLRESYRFRPGSALAHLAARIRDGDAAGAIELLQSPPGAAADSSVEWYPDAPPSALLDRIMEGYAGYLDAVRMHRPPADVFAAAGKFRVLCALRGGPFGVERINAAIERRLRPPGAPADNYAGRMVMITVNDHGARLYNGDLGIVLPDESGVPALWVPGEGERLRRIPPSRLPAHETAFAMTVHKSQGSEFERVLVVLPAQPAAVITRELLYTAVSRARAGTCLFGAPAVIESAILSRQSRDSGLSELLHSS
jgi:exodeoxyribonuclease V alpha subunit